MFILLYTVNSVSRITGPQDDDDDDDDDDKFWINV